MKNIIMKEMIIVNNVKWNMAYNGSETNIEIIMANIK